MLTVSDERELEYIIPRRIRQGYEFAPGWGVKQVICLLAGLVAGVLLFLAIRLLVIHHLRIPIFFQVFPPLIVAGAGVIATMPQMDGITVLERIENWQAWSKRQKLYLFDWSRDDW